MRRSGFARFLDALGLAGGSLLVYTATFADGGFLTSVVGNELTFVIGFFVTVTSAMDIYLDRKEDRLP